MHRVIVQRDKFGLSGQGNDAEADYDCWKNAAQRVIPSILIWARNRDGWQPELSILIHIISTARRSINDL